MARPSVEAERREQILSGTCAVVSERGFRSLRVADVARRVGTSTGTIHYYFPTKRELLRAAFEYNFRTSIERRKEILERQADPVDKLRCFIESYLPTTEETIRAWRVWAELWVEGLHDPELQSVNDAIYGEWRTIVAVMIREGQTMGVVRAGDPIAFANALIGLVDGLAIQVLVQSRSMNVDEMLKVCFTVLDEAIIKPGVAEIRRSG